MFRIDDPPVAAYHVLAGLIDSIFLLAVFLGSISLMIFNSQSNLNRYIDLVSPKF